MWISPLEVSVKVVHNFESYLKYDLPIKNVTTIEILQDLLFSEQTN